MRGSDVTRWPIRFAAWAPLAILMAPAVAPWFSAFLDRGPDGSVRASAFPLALALLDPFLLTCARNSVLAAAAIALGSTACGVGLGCLVAGDRFRGRGLLGALAMVPLAAGPLLIAPALAWSVVGPRGWDWLSGRTWMGIPADLPARWALLTWAGVAWGAPLVAMATSAGLRRVDPAWTEAARAFGASRRGAWRDVAWPLIRPGVARASALVFTLALVEPAGPIVLGLPRTLAVQLVRASTRLDQPTRASILALMAFALAIAGRAAFGWWGGPGRLPASGPFAGRAGPRRGPLRGFPLAAWGVVTAGPLAAWLWRAFEAGRPGSDPGSGWAVEGWEAWAANSFATAGLAVLVDLLLLAALAPRGGGRSARAAGRLFATIPPLALGAGALAIPWLLSAVAEAAGEPAGSWLRPIAREFDPGRSPGLLLALALAGVLWPALVGALDAVRVPDRGAPADAARLVGASGRVPGSGRWPGPVPLAQALAALLLGATCLAPALLLTPTAERRTLAPALLELVRPPGPPDPRVAWPAASLLGINLAALALAASGWARREAREAS